MTDVWVLSEESPFCDEEESGGCVSGVFTTPTAALFYLGSVELGFEALEALTWYAWSPHRYEGRGWETAIYILQRHDVQQEVTLRADYQALSTQYGWGAHAWRTMTTQELQAMLTPETTREEWGA